MKVKRPFYFGVGVLLVIPLGYLLVDRIEFTMRSQQTSGIVTNIQGTNDRCGRKRSRHNCTKFQATLGYRVNGMQFHISVTAGTARGHNQAITRSKYRIGERERVAYDQWKPSRAYRDTLWDIWGAPILTLFLQIAALIASVNEKRQSGVAANSIARKIAPVRGFRHRAKSR